jgi:threonine-phosphate decarboxylase
MRANLVAAVHGGDLAGIARRYGISPAELVDFSSNLNALGPPESLLRALSAAACDRDALRRYPDPEGGPLRAALASRLGVVPEAVVIGNGAAALIDAAVRVRDVRRCLVPVPAFSEYARALASARAELVPLPLEASDDFRLRPSRVAAALACEPVDAILFSNPHNPSGSITSRANVQRIVHRVRDAKALAIVDEAFIDYAPGESITAWAAETPGTIVIRSLTKFFAVPALRVGYAVCVPELASRLRAVSPSWPVTTLVATALEAALGDEDYALRTLRETSDERDRFTSRLRLLGMHVVPAAANFLLLELPGGAPRAEELVRRLIVSSGLVVRDCSTYDGLPHGLYVRVALRSKDENDLLVAALDACL